MNLRLLTKQSVDIWQFSRVKVIVRVVAQGDKPSFLALAIRCDCPYKRRHKRAEEGGVRQRLVTWHMVMGHEGTNQ